MEQIALIPHLLLPLCILASLLFVMLEEVFTSLQLYVYFPWLLGRREWSVDFLFLLLLLPFSIASVAIRG